MQRITRILLVLIVLVPLATLRRSYGFDLAYSVYERVNGLAESSLRRVAREPEPRLWHSSRTYVDCRR